MKIIILSILGFLVSCNKTQPNFINIKKCNQDLLTETNIDILKFKIKVDSLYKIDSKIYDKTIDEFISDGNETILYNTLGFIKKNNGVGLNLSDGDSVTQKFYKILQNNIEMTDCQLGNSSKICTEKKRVEIALGKMIEVNISNE